MENIFTCNRLRFNSVVLATVIICICAFVDESVTSAYDGKNDWPGFRGRNMDGIAIECGIFRTWFQLPA